MMRLDGIGPRQFHLRSKVDSKPVGRAVHALQSEKATMSTPEAFAATLVMVLWGVNFLAVKQTVDYLPPFLSVGMRFAAVAMCLIPWAPYPRGHSKELAVSGFLLGVGHFGLLFLGMQLADVGLTAVINRFGGVLLAVLGVVMLGEVVSIRLWLGLAISMVGVVVLVADNPQVGVSLSTTTALGATILLISSSSWSFATVYMKSRLSKVSTIGQLAWVAFYSVPGCLVCSWLFEANQLGAVRDAPLAAWVGFGYTIIGSSLVAYGLWYELVKRCAVSRLSPFLFLMPLVGVAAGVVFRGEQLTAMRGLGTLLILYAMRLSR